MTNPDARQPFGYGGADASASRPGWASGASGGVDHDARTDAVPAVGPIARPRRSHTGRNLVLGGGAALLLTSAFIAGQMRGPDYAAASGPGPGSTPTSTDTPGAIMTATPGSQDHELTPGQCLDLTASSNEVIIVQGDVTINGDHTYDSDAQSAAEAVLTNGDYDICAPWGADVQQTDQNQADCILGADTDQALAKGFQRVTVFKFDNGHMVQGSR